MSIEIFRSEYPGSSLQVSERRADGSGHVALAVRQAGRNHVHKIVRSETGELFNALGRTLANGDPSMAVEIEPRERMAIFGEIHVERQRQDEQWGGAEHDDEHMANDWLRYIAYQMQHARDSTELRTGDRRQRFVKIAALALAAIESFDRHAE